MLEKEHKHYCKRGCGTVVWSSLSIERKPNFTETVLCPHCGADNSVRPTLSQRWKYAHTLMKRRRRVLGFWWWTRQRFWNCFRMPYEMRPRP